MKSAMPWKIGVGSAVAVLAVVTFAARSVRDRGPAEGPEAAQAELGEESGAVSGSDLPVLLFLGAGQCIPCKMMEPIREELRREHEGRMRIDYIDVWRDADAGRNYGIRMIPTLIFFDASGNELGRHEGFIAKDDIIAKWASLGVTFGGTD